MELLSYSAFVIRLEKMLDKFYEGKWEHLGNVFKVNEIKQGIAIECGEGVSVVVYPTELYKAYEAEESMDVVMEIIENAIENKNIVASISKFADWEEVKYRIKPFVINYEKNKELVEAKELVFMRKLDLVYGYYIEIKNDVIGQAGAYVTVEMLKYWGVSEPDLYDAAKNNAQYQIVTMEMAIKNLLEDTIACDNIDTDSRLYVLSNCDTYRGAAGMFDTDTLTAAAEKLDCNFFILPSSCHEVILVRDDGDEDAYELRNMVEEINRSELKPEDFLSDSVYYYDRDENAIKIVA